MSIQPYRGMFEVDTTLMFSKLLYSFYGLEEVNFPLINNSLKQIITLKSNFQKNENALLKNAVSEYPLLCTADISQTISLVVIFGTI